LRQHFVLEGSPLKKSRSTESQIVAIVQGGEAGVTVAQLTRKHGISAATCHHWKSKYAGAGLPVDHRDLVPFTGEEPRA
jgi:putative transposase